MRRFSFLFLVFLFAALHSAGQPLTVSGATCQSTYGTAGEPVDTDASLCGTLTPYASTTTSGPTTCASPVGGGTITVASTANFAAAGAGSICNNSGQCTPFLYTSKDASNFLGVTNGTQGQIPACSIAYPPNSRVYAKDTANVADTRWNVLKSAAQGAQKYDGPVLAGNQLPAPGTVGQKAIVTGTDGYSCTSIGGSTTMKCFDNGSSWVPYATLEKLAVAGEEGQANSRLHCMELVNIDSTGTNVFQTSSCQIPANATVISVPIRIVTAVGGTPTMTVSATTSGTFFQTGTSIASTLNNTDPGNKPGPASYNGVAQQTISLTFTTNPSNTNGQVRVDIFYEISTPATS